jgi:hypothetical protein
MSAESKNGDLQFALDHWIAVADTLKQQRGSAEKERDALRKDAARLDWLGKFGVRIDLPRPENSKPVWVVFSDNLTGLNATYPTANGATIREAIDAAMKAKV